MLTFCLEGGVSTENIIHSLDTIARGSEPYKSKVWCECGARVKVRGHQIHWGKKISLEKFIEVRAAHRQL